MTTELVAILGALAALLTAVGTYIKVTYGKPKAMADAEAQRLANAAYPVAALQSTVALMQQQIGRVTSDLRQTQRELDSALDRIGILSGENQAWSLYHQRVTDYNRRVAQQMAAAGMEVPYPPDPPEPRTQFTRRTDFPDFPTRSEFETWQREQHGHHDGGSDDPST